MSATRISSDQTDVVSLTPVSAPTGPSGRKKVTLVSRLIILMGVVLGLMAVGGTASAWQTYSTGRVGPVNVVPSVYNGGATFAVGRLIIYRNGAVPVGTPQQAVVRTELQYWRNNTWVTADVAAEPVVLPMDTGTPGLSSSWQMYPRLNGTGDRPGYYRVIYTVAWGQGYSVASLGTATGIQTIIPSTTSDIRCGVTTCRVNANYVQVW